MKTANRMKLAAMVMTAGLIGATAVWAKPPVTQTLEDRVRHELRMLPRYTIFDDLSFRVDGNVVTLFGQVTQPYKKSDAENAVKHVEGVARVDDQIEVLPLSPMDDGIRLREYRAIFSGPLYRYAMGAIPPIHIIVKNGNVKLVGVVANKMDSQIAYMRANGVPGVFSVDNQLQIENK